MTTYISIVRGINVTGKNLIKMDLLQKSYERLGYQNIRTYVQSGNVIFRAEPFPPKELERTLSALIEKDFGYKVPVIVLTIDQLRRVIERNPFTPDPSKDPAYLHVTFLSSTPDLADFEAIESKKQDGEEIHISQDAVYLYCPKGYGKTKLNNSFLEAKLQVPATTRNWKTTNELLKLALEVGNTS